MIHSAFPIAYLGELEEEWSVTINGVDILFSDITFAIKDEALLMGATLYDEDEDNCIIVDLARMFPEKGLLDGYYLKIDKKKYLPEEEEVDLS